MTKPILVVYATKRESTHEVADALASRMRRLGHEVDVRPAAEVGTLRPYGGVVLGGALYMGRWHRDARHFLTRHRSEITELLVAIFAMGPLKLEPEDIDGARAQLDRALAKEREVQPVAIAIFGGAVDPPKLRFPFNHMPASDARDWDAIRSWADEVVTSFAPRVAA